LLRKYRDGLIAASACLHGEIPWLLCHEGVDAAMKVISEYVDLFGSDFYFELQEWASFEFFQT